MAIKNHSRESATVRGAALLAALVPVGALVPVDSATAQIEIQDPPRPPYSSRVDSTVTPNGANFDYGFTVHNTTSSTCFDSGGDAPGTCDEFLIVDWELPLFSLDDILPGSIVSPDGWEYEIITDPANQTFGLTEFGQYTWDYDAASDPLLISTPGLYGNNPEVFNTPPLIIHWYTFVDPEGGSACLIPINCARPIFEGDSLSGFGFSSAYGDTNAPYLSSWVFQPPVGGDPPIPDQGFGTPNSPARMAAQNPGTPPTPMPTPGPLPLLLAGLATLFAARRGKSTR